MATVTKKELIDRIADETGMKRVQVKRVVQEFLDEIIAELGRGNRLEFRDFGVFECKLRAPRIAQNPKTLERVPVNAKHTVKFKVGRLMKQSLQNLTENSDVDDALPDSTMSDDYTDSGSSAAASKDAFVSHNGQSNN